MVSTQSIFKSASVGACMAVALLASTVGHADTLSDIKESGRITLGVRDSSGVLSYTLGPGKYVGYQVDICEQIVSNIKRSLKLDKLEVQYQLVTPNNRIPLLANKTIQMECGSTTNNASRLAQVSFSPTTYVESVRIAVKATSPAQKFVDLSGKTVAATSGSTAVQAIRKLNRQASNPAVELFGKDNADSFLLLETGRADALAADGQILAMAISKSRSPSELKILDQVYSVEPIAIMLPKDDPALKKIVDETVASMASSGALAKLYEKWFQQPVPPQGNKLGLEASALTKAAWASPNDKPMEEYADK